MSMQVPHLTVVGQVRDANLLDAATNMSVACYLPSGLRLVLMSEASLSLTTMS